MIEGLIQPMHLLVILLLALIVFGPKKVPELGKSLGEGIRSFKESFREKEQERTGVEKTNGHESPETSDHRV